jgi:hypothetical protein
MRSFTAGAVLHLVAVGLGVGGELLEVVRRQVLPRQQDLRRVHDQRHRREVGRRVVGRLLVHRLVDRMGADRAEREHVAVGRRIGDAQRPGRAAAARHILDHHLLAERLAEMRLQQAGQNVDRPAGREGHHHSYRPRRPVLRRRRRGQHQSDCHRRSAGQGFEPHE